MYIVPPPREVILAEIDLGKGRPRRPSKVNLPSPGRKMASYVWFRAPRTFAEIRANAWHNAKAGEPAPRPKRKKGILPSASDDLSRNVERSWKRHRLTRWL